MGQLSNVAGILPMRLAQRKSFSLGLYLRTAKDYPAEITGHTITFVLAKQKHQGGTVLLTKTFTLDIPLGFARLDLQAVDLDLPEGTYDYVVTLLTPEGYSGELFQGPLEVAYNPDPSTAGTFTGVGTAETIIYTLSQVNTVNLVIGPMTPPVPSGVIPIVTGSRGGNAALASLLTGLASAGVLVDSTTA